MYLQLSTIIYTYIHVPLYESDTLAITMYLHLRCQDLEKKISWGNVYVVVLLRCCQVRVQVRIWVRV